MADCDPGIANAVERDWQGIRHDMARAALRRMVAMVEARDTERADGPLPLHKGVYIDEARFAAEREHLFLGQPIVAGLSGDIPNPGDLLVFDAVDPRLARQGRGGSRLP